MKIATWNVNGIKAREDNLEAWLRQASPDVACLQEIKCIDDAFPRARFEALGYHVATHGQKGFNGVAILSRLPLEDVTRGLPGDPSDEQARYIEAVVSRPAGAVRVVCIYLPNGNPVGTDKFSYKLSWMNRLRARAAELLAFEELLSIAGDYNVIPEPADCRDPDAWTDDALFQPQTRAAFRELASLGMTDAIRATSDAPGLYTFWDYQAGAWQKDNGIRIDHLMLSPEAADRLAGAGIDRFTREWEKPSDHVPVWVVLDA
jgi:exodeoxyribonuclease-3